MAWKCNPQCPRPPRRAWKWKPWSPLPPRPSQSTTCAKPSIKGWKSRTSCSPRRAGGRAGTSIGGRLSRGARDEHGRKQKRKAAPGGGQPAGAWRRGFHRQAIFDQGSGAHHEKSCRPPAPRKTAEESVAAGSHSGTAGRDEHDRPDAVAGDGAEVVRVDRAAKRRAV